MAEDLAANLSSDGDTFLADEGDEYDQKSYLALRVILLLAFYLAAVSVNSGIVLYEDEVADVYRTLVRRAPEVSLRAMQAR